MHSILHGDRGPEQLVSIPRTRLLNDPPGRGSPTSLKHCHCPPELLSLGQHVTSTAPTWYTQTRGKIPRNMTYRPPQACKLPAVIPRATFPLLVLYSLPLYVPTPHRHIRHKTRQLTTGGKEGGRTGLCINLMNVSAT